MIGSSSGASPEEVLQRNRTLATKALQPFAGKRLVGDVLYRQEIDSQTVEEPRYHYEFHLATASRWRLNVVYSDGYESVFVRNGGLFFTAVRQSDKRPFGYSVVGFDPTIRKEVSSSALARSAIIEGTTHVMGETAADFLTGDFGVEPHHVRPVQEGNRRMQWEWDWPARNSSGSMELLETGLVSSFKNLTEGTEYTVEYDEGLPVRMTDLLNSNTTVVNRAAWFSDPNSDPNYYTPESIGLRSPSSPWRIYGLYVLVVIACAAIATWIVKKRLAQ
ncbi:MAG: hypothetical protein DWH99_13000 [Planctomycetota bacterium]|nr:MAG: hypothetical protein DWH99_13000 [Planctomycetota bacterium]